MLTVPLYPALFVFLFFLLGIIIFSFVNVGHLVHTGTMDIKSFTFTLIFFVYLVLVLFATWYFLQATDWQQPIVIWNSAWTGGGLGGGIVN